MNALRGFRVIRAVRGILIVALLGASACAGGEDLTAGLGECAPLMPESVPDFGRGTTIYADPSGEELEGTCAERMGEPEVAELAARVVGFADRAPCEPGGWYFAGGDSCDIDLNRTCGVATGLVVQVVGVVATRERGAVGDVDVLVFQAAAGEEPRPDGAALCESRYRLRWSYFER